ncbi:MAG: hypothetical protein JWP81_4427 [Ferruginibacter sp.]|nr:hypothetical protein [Ferruginibacter sp.]
MSFPFFYIVLVIAVLISVIKLKRQKPSYLRLFFPYLLMNLCVETFGLITRAQGKNNYWIYNFSTTVEFGFYFFIFYKTLHNVFVKRAIIFTSFLFFPFCIINIFFIQGIHHFHSISFLMGSIFLVSLSVLYFQEQLREDEQITNPLTEKMFWISTGVLFFYVTSLFSLGLFELIHLKNPSLKVLADALLNLLNIFLYCTFIISFFIGNKNER